MKNKYPRSIVLMKPHHFGCVAGVRAPRHNALGFAMFGPNYHNCRRDRREGCLTCWQHRHLEGQAQQIAKQREGGEG